MFYESIRKHNNFRVYQERSATAMEFRALVAFGSKRDRQGSAVGEQYEFVHPQQVTTN